MIKFAIMKNFLNYNNAYGMNPFNGLDELYIDSTFEELRLGLLPFDLHNRLKEMFERVSTDLKRTGSKTYLFSTNSKITEKQLGVFTSKNNKKIPTQLTTLNFNFSTLQEMRVDGAFNFLVSSGLFAIKLIKVKDLNNVIFLKPSVFTTNEFSFSFDVENFASVGQLIDNEEYILDYEILLDKTSQLINDGEDGINPFITLLDSTLQSVTNNGNVTTNNILVRAAPGSAFTAMTTQSVSATSPEDNNSTKMYSDRIESKEVNFNRGFENTVNTYNSIPTETETYEHYRPNKSGTYAMVDDVELKANISGQIFTGNILAPNLSGTNTGDNATNSQYSGLALSKENTISAGTTAQYFRGDKTFQTLNSTAVGLGNVDNTSDINKPISTATQTALNGKANISGQVFTGAISATNLSGTNTGDQDLSPYATNVNLDLKANIESPTFTGTVGGITKAMVGLPNVDNTTDLNKPISTATQSALDLKINLTEKGVANGVVPLDSGAKILTTYLPDSILGNLKYAGTYDGFVINASADFPELQGLDLPIVGYVGIYFITTTEFTRASITYNVGDWVLHNGGNDYVKVDNTDAVTTVFGRLGNILANQADYASFYYSINNPSNFISRTSLSFFAGSGAYNPLTGVITIPTNNNQITNGAGFITSSALSPYALLSGATFTGPVSGITKAMVGLANVDNTSDLNKPISTATQTALDSKQNNLGFTPYNSTNPSGFTANSTDAQLRDRATHTGVQLSSTISDIQSAITNNTNVLANTAKVGITTAQANAIGANTLKVTNANHTGEVTGETALTITNNIVTNVKLSQVPTKTFKGRTSASTGNVEDLTVAQVRTDLFINNVDNTSDVNKPVSTATQNALNLKANTSSLGSNAFNSTAFLTSYTETDTLASVTARGHATGTTINLSSITPIQFGAAAASDLYLGVIAGTRILEIRNGNAASPNYAACGLITGFGDFRAQVKISAGSTVLNGQVNDNSSINLGLVANNYGYGISTNNSGGLDIMSNQSGCPIRFWSGTTNENPTQTAQFLGLNSTFYGRVHVGNYLSLVTGTDNFAAGVPWYGLGYPSGGTNNVHLSGYFGIQFNTSGGLVTINSGGSITTNGTVTATSFFQSSDIRLKNIIKRDGDVIYYTWKDERDTKTHIGYSAQEVIKENPEQVNEDSEKMLSVNYIEILVEKIRNLEKEIELLKLR